MSAVEPLYRVINKNLHHWPKNEISILEAKAFLCVHKGLVEFFLFQTKVTSEREKQMLEENFIQLITKDMLSLEEYTIEGIALYAHTHEEVILDIVTGKNTNPSLKLARKIIELHQLVRPDLYRSILQKSFKDEDDDELS